MVRKTNRSNPLGKYEVYLGGMLVGILVLTPELVRKLESTGYRLKRINAPITRAKARTILHDREIGGRPLTPKQRKFFGARASGSKVSKVKRATNPKELTLIYKDITRIEGTKGKGSLYPAQRFYHNFKRPYPSMYGTADRKILVIKK